MDIAKKFFDWIKLKEKLHNGKGNKFSRPVIIYKKLSRDGFLGIPTSTKLKKGSWYVEVTHSQRNITLLLSQIRVMSSNRLLEKMGELDDVDCHKVGKAFTDLFISSNKKFVPPF